MCVEIIRFFLYNCPVGAPLFIARLTFRTEFYGTFFATWWADRGHSVSALSILLHWSFGWCWHKHYTTSIAVALGKASDTANPPALCHFKIAFLCVFSSEKSWFCVYRIYMWHLIMCMKCRMIKVNKPSCWSQKQTCHFLLRLWWIYRSVWIKLTSYMNFLANEHIHALFRF